MLTVNQLVGFGVGGRQMPPNLTYVGRTSVTSGINATQTVVGVNLGTANANKRVIIIVTGVSWYNPTSIDFSNLSAAGVSLTLAANYGVAGVDSFSRCVMFYGSVPAASGNVVFNITNQGSVTSFELAVFTTNTESPLTFVSSASGTGVTTVLSMNTQVGDLVVAAAHTSESQASTWTGLTEKYDVGTDFGHYSAASHVCTASETPRTMSRYALNPSSRSNAALACVFR